MNKAITTLQKTQTQQYNAFALKIKALIELLSIDLTSFIPDHVAIRTHTWDRTQALHNAWLKKGHTLSNTTINGRPIIVFELFEALHIGDWRINCLELPYPGETFYPEEGLEHIEFVIPSQANSIEAFQETLFETFPTLRLNWHCLKDKGITVKASMPQGAHERLPNPTFAFQKDGICIKLHPHSLKDIIVSEKTD